MQYNSAEVSYIYNILKHSTNHALVRKLYKLGALRERMGETGAGWLVDVSSGEKLYEQLIAIAEDFQGYQKALDNLAGVQLKSNEQMAADYTKVYEDLLGGARR